VLFVLVERFAGGGAGHTPVPPAPPAGPTPLVVPEHST